MTISNRSLIAIALTTVLAGCNVDSDPTVPLPTDPEPLVPAPAEEITVQIGDTAVKAMKESLVITSNTENDKIGYVEAFKGIKFAEAERFEHSETVDLSELLADNDFVDATVFGDVCPQTKKTELEQSEDCLNLNIWRPVSNNLDEALPVYVFIHGGDFEYGAGSNALVQGDTVVAQGASEGNQFIYVSFNYRLGLLGTRWVKGANTNGNYGIGDQKALLKWINENIESFGGDKNRVTLMGQGSGAMSIALLQQQVEQGELNGEYIERAIMQSTPYGFEYSSYDARKARYDDLGLAKLPTDKEIPESLDTIIDKQREMLNPLKKIEYWLLRNVGALDIDWTGLLSSSDEVTTDIELGDVISYFLGKLSVLTSADNTPNSEFMPFAPYLECHKTSFLSGCKDPQSQPVNSDFVVPTVIGNNAKDANTMSMLPTLTFLIPTILELLQEDIDNGTFEPIEEDNTALNLLAWLQQDDNQQRVVDMVSGMSADEVSAQVELGDVLELLPSSAYEAVTKLFFGLGNSDMNNSLLELTDYAPWAEGELGGATKNMAQFKMLMNDMLFQGPARNQAIKAANNPEASATLYHFAFKPSFNVWTHNTGGQEGDLDIGDLLKSVACFSGACSGSELPFIFNKPFKMDGTEVSPMSKDQALMNEMSRLWFSEQLFTDYEYNASQDNMLFIDSSGEFSHELDWDSVHNEATDTHLRNGRLQGLNDLGLMLNYMLDYEIPQQ
ncbi:carboxylesterase family protein [Vibrio agarivorans]|uniref:carboxylesterase family protein n=1 Tax=Vibrio agarivorans TaxID=153622 RepID=UPI00222F2198|nr:carboxylesterase family protein [Vibrio agarivorans]